MAKNLSQILKSDSMKVIVALSEFGSVRRSADALAMTPSAVSKHLKRIEEGVGRTLFHRDHNGVRPNDEGIVFTQYAERFLALSNEIGQRFGQDVLTGSVRLGVTDDVGLARIPELLRFCKVSHPQISIELVVDYTRELIEAADARRVDIAILSDGGPSFPNKATKLSSERLVWAKKPGLDPSGAAVPLVLSSHGCKWRERGLSALSEAGFKYRIFCTSPSVAGQLSAVQLGLGIAPIPESVVENIPGIAIYEGEWPDLGKTQLATYQTAPDEPTIRCVLQAIQRTYG